MQKKKRKRKGKRSRKGTNSGGHQSVGTGCQKRLHNTRVKNKNILQKGCGDGDGDGDGDENGDQKQEQSSADKAWGRTLHRTGNPETGERTSRRAFSGRAWDSHGVACYLRGVTIHVHVRIRRCRRACRSSRGGASPAA